MIEVRCNRCNKLLVEVSDDSAGTVICFCLRCREKRTMVLTPRFKDIARERQLRRRSQKVVAVNNRVALDSASTSRPARGPE